MKKIIVALLVLFLMTGCTVQKDEEDNSTFDSSTTDSLDETFYPIVNLGTNVIREAFYKDFYSTDDLQKIGRELQVLSTEYFSTSSHYMSEGLQLVQEDKAKLLLRANKETLQPKKGKSIEGVKEPTMIENIHELDFYEKNGKNYELKGLSIALVLNTTAKVGDDIHQFSESTLKKYATESIQKMYQYCQTIKDIKDLPILMTVYLRNDSTINSYNGRFLYESYCQKGKVGKIKELDYATYVFTSNEARQADEETSSQFTLFKNNVKNAVTEAVGIVGYGRYKDKKIQSLKIQVTANVKSYTELIYVVEMVADEMDERFKGFDSYAIINDQNGLKAVVVKDVGENAKSTLLY